MSLELGRTSKKAGAIYPQPPNGWFRGVFKSSYLLTISCCTFLASEITFKGHSRKKNTII